MFCSGGGGAGYALHTDDDNYDDLDLPPYMGSFNFGESDPDLVEGVEVVDGEQFYNAMAPVDHHLSSSTIATDDADGMIMDDPSLLLEPAIPSDYELDSTTSSSEANAINVAARTDISSPSLHTELDLATGSTKMVQSPPVLMSQRRTKSTIATDISTSALAAAALTNEFHRLDSSSTQNKRARHSGDQEHPVSAERNSVGGASSENESQSPSTPAKAGGKRKAATVAAAGVGIAGLATIAVYGNRILKRFRDDDGDNEEAANYEVQDQDLGGDLYAQQQQGQGQAQPQSQGQGQGQGQTAQGPTGAEQGAAGQAMAQTQLQVAQAMVAQASSGIDSSAGAVGGAAGAAAAAAAAATAAGAGAAGAAAGAAAGGAGAAAGVVGVAAVGAISAGAYYYPAMQARRDGNTTGAIGTANGDVTPEGLVTLKPSSGASNQIGSPSPSDVLTSFPDLPPSTIPEQVPAFTPTYSQESLQGGEGFGGGSGSSSPMPTTTTSSIGGGDANGGGSSLVPTIVGGDSDGAEGNSAGALSHFERL